MRDPNNKTILEIVVNYTTIPRNNGIMAWQHIEVEIEMMLKVNGYQVRGLTLTLEANDRNGDPDRLRDELRRYSQVQAHYFAPPPKKLKPDFEWMDIYIVDQAGVLKWLGIDLADTFKKAYNGQPLLNQ